ncbi:MAG: caspase family protein [Alphaproteobacteria bacterium]|nr:caspase family protein [Alphaproteobacteria bacterium]
MRFWVVAFLCVFVSFHSPASGNTPETRKALVIGNGAYGVSPLPNPINDAQAMTEALEMSGFDVTLATDLSYRDLQRAVVRFSREVRAAGEETVAMVYYAGHAVQANGENYLIPVDADIQDSLDLEIQSLRLSTVMQSLESAGNRLNLVVLDACRDNPFPSMSRSGSRGLAKVDAPYGTLLAYSTAPGDVAADGAGRNSPYTAALIKALRVPGLPVEQVFKRVRVDVMERTGKQQVPWESSSLTGDFFFTPERPAVTAAQPAAPVPPPAPDTSEEIDYWRSIATSDDTTLFESYLAQYPDGLFADIARQRIDALAAARLSREAEQANARRLEEAKAFWESVKDSPDPSLFMPLIESYGDTFYAKLAQARIESLNAQAEANRARAQQQAAQVDQPQQTAALSTPAAPPEPLQSAAPSGAQWRIEWSVGRSQGSDAFCRPGENAALDFTLVDGAFSGRLTSSQGHYADLKMSTSSSGRLRVDARIPRWVQSRNVFFLDLDDDGDRIEFVTPNGFACMLIIELVKL